MAITFSFSSKNSDHFAIPQNGVEKFFIGRRTSYQDNTGLFNVKTTPGLIYDPAAFESASGFWAWFIFPTSRCESRGSYYCLNTYDRAKFTFGFLQYAAHVPNGDFVKYFKKLLSLALAPEYFPKLALNNNRIFYRRDNGTLVQLEDDHSTQALMDYLNPSLNEVEQQELISCARMVHWAMNDPEHIKVQVETGIGLFRENIKTYAKQYNLDNAPDKVCLVICDIRHQGRAKNYEIFAAMNTGGDWEKAFNNLLDLGSVHYPDRIKTLKSSVSDLIRQGILGKKKYSISVADFIDL